MDPTVLYILEQNIMAIVRPLGYDLKKWIITCGNHSFYPIVWPTSITIAISSFFKEYLTNTELQQVIESIRESNIIDVYKVKILEYLVNLKQSQDKDNQMNKFFSRLEVMDEKINQIDDRLEVMDEKINQIDDRFKIIIDMMDPAKRT